MAQRRLRRGFTLLESIFSFVILSFVLMVLFSLYPSSAAGTRRAEQQMQADALAQSVLEDCRARPFAALTPGPATLPPVEVAGVSYARAVEVVALPPASPKRLLAVRVLVSWTDRSRKRSVRHELRMANVGR